MSPRDLFEDSWHLSLLGLALPPVLRRLLGSVWLRLLLAVVVLAALAYHVAVVQACYAHKSLCYWGSLR